MRDDMRRRAWPAATLLLVGAAGNYCCNVSCGLCAPIGATCIQATCTPDAAVIVGDGGACVAVPAQDTSCGGAKPPHFYACVVATLPPPCQVLTIGNVTDI